MQPHRFEVIASETNAEVIAVQEAVDELLEVAKKEWNNWNIQFDMLITLEWDDSTISYTVAPGDTLSEIAKLFGTTSSAIAEANGISVWKVLRVGQKLKIAYDKSIIYDLEEEILVWDFSEKFLIPLDELLTLNNFEDETTMLEIGQQIFVPLNRLEAQDRWLIKKKEFVMLDLPRKIIADTIDDPLNDPVPQEIIGEPWQVIITAEDTKKHLEALVQAEKEAAISQAKAEETARLAEEARIAAEEAKVLADKEQKAAEQEASRIAAEAAAKTAETARLAQEEAVRKAEILEKAEAEERKRQQEWLIAQERAIAESCSDAQCYHEWKCWSKPENSVCAPTDPDNAWTCNAWFIDTWKLCISEQQHIERTAQATAPKKTQWVLKQRYFNPYNDGYWWNGWAWWHCTMYVGRWIWKNKWIHTQWRWNAKYWYDNAAAAWWSVWQTPQIWSVIVMKYGSQWWNGYGHVWIVIDIDRSTRQVLIEDMNYVGRYVVSQHRVDIDSAKNPVIWYIYP